MATESPIGNDAPTLAEFFPLKDLPQRLRRFGKKLSYPSLWRWSNHGIRGVKLRTIRIGQVPSTCDRWTMQFFEELARVGNKPAIRITGRTPAARERDILRTRRRLAKLGI